MKKQTLRRSISLLLTIMILMMSVGSVFAEQPVEETQNDAVNSELLIENEKITEPVESREEDEIEKLDKELSQKNIELEKEETKQVIEADARERELVSEENTEKADETESEETTIEINALVDESEISFSVEEFPEGVPAAEKLFEADVVSEQSDSIEAHDDTGLLTSVITDPITIPVASINLTGKTTLKVGESDYPSYTVLPETATNKTLSWSSQDTAVATVENGVVYAVGEGKTLIYARAEDNSNVWTYYELNVTPAFVDVTKVSNVVLHGITDLAVGKSYAIPYEVFPATATNKAVNWHTSDSSIVSVNEYGVIKAESKGEATITGISAEDSTIFDSFKVTVGALQPVTKIDVVVTPTMLIGDVYYSSYAVYPDNASDKSVTWSSSNTGVATVDQYGIVTAVGVGSTVITLTSNSDTKVYGSYAVVVTDIPATWLAVSAKSQLLVGESDPIVYVLYPENTTSSKVTWSSSNTSVATVSEQGIVKGVRTGTATITGKVVDSVGVTASYTVMVTKTASPVKSVTISGPNTVAVGGNATLSALVTPENAYNQKLYWVSDNPAVAVVNQEGLVVGVSAGVAVISAIATDGSLVRGMYTINVKNSVQAVTDVIAAGKSILYPGETDYAYYGILPSGADDTRVKWSSSNTKVVTVDETYGIVKAVAAGTAIITATSCDGTNVAGNYTVTVKDSMINVSKIAITGHPVLGLGTTDYLSYEVWPTNADNKTVAWKSSNPSVAKVDPVYGIVTAEKIGTATITATAVDGSKTYATHIVSVQNVTTQVTRIEVYGSGSLAAGGSEYLGYAVWPEDAGNKTVTWTSNNPSVATVTATTGIVTAVSGGVATITAKANDGSGVYGTYYVLVSDSSVKVSTVNIYGRSTLALNEIEYLGYEIYPANATNKAVTWVTSNSSVATVDLVTGVVTAKHAGVAVITATAMDGSGESASWTINVNP